MPGSEKPAEPLAQDPVWTPRVEADREAVREELARILADPLFRNSRRYPSFLKYVVEQSLEGNADALKERTIGIEVFSREPDYDTNVDHTVRNVAVEVRKRLGEYYYDPAHATGLRFEIPAGAYAPTFRRQGQPGADNRPDGLLPAPSDGPALVSPRWRVGRRVGMIAVCVVALLALAGITYRLNRASDPVERFWAPLLAGREPVLFFIAGPGPTPGFSAPPRSGELVTFPEATALVQLAGLLRGYRRDVRVAYAGSSRVSDLSAGTSVLLGTADDELVRVMTAPHRFHFESDAAATTLVDSEGARKTLGVVARNVPYSQLAADYAVVCRVHGRYSGKNLIIISAATPLGVAGAARFVTSPQSLDVLARSASQGWEARNVEVALRIRIDRGSPFPAEIQAIHLW